MFRIEYSINQIQFSVDESKIDPTVFDYYYSWLKLMNKKLEHQEPWVPIGRVGPCIVIAHYIELDQQHPVPDLFMEKILIQEDDYKCILKKFQEHSFLGKNYHKPTEINNECIHVKGDIKALGLIYSACPVEEELATEILMHLNSDTELTDLPKNLFVACNHVKSKLGFLDLSVLKVNLEHNRLLPIALLDHHKCIIIAANAMHIWIGVSKNPSIQLEDLILSKLSAQSKKISFKICSEESILELIDEFKSKNHQFTSYYGTLSENKNSEKNISDKNDCLLIDEYRCEGLNPLDPIVTSEEIFQWILFQAHIRKASDIHIEHTSLAGRIRIRIDGDLHMLLELPLEQSKALVLVCKNACRMKPNDFDNQDASFIFQCGEQSINVRANAIPFRQSFQKLALRLFTQSNSKVTIDDLKIPTDQVALLRKCLARPQGLILVSGPTGEGKTTTLYASLEELNKTNRNIQTIEDPIERQIEGINQTCVDLARGVTFASVMRSIVRQDPDIILLGEIRDRETAELAIESSLTGHLVLTTIHANSSIKALARLYQLGVDPHLLSNSLLLLQAQRLLRKLCNKCKKLECAEETYYNPVGCHWCNHTGYKGRIPVMEFFPICEEVQSAIASKATFSQLKHIFDKRGYKSLYLEALERAKEGVVCRSDAYAYHESWIL